MRIAIFILGILLTSCFSKNEIESGSRKIKISMLVDGVLDDKSFNSSANEALLRLKKNFPESIEKVFSSAVSGVYSSYVSDLDNLKRNGSDLIWLVGYRLTDASLLVSSENPEISYGIIDPIYVDDVHIPKNLTAVVFRVEQGAFLAGYIAAKKSFSGKIGFIGGVKGSIVDAFRYGYEAGAKYANKNIEIMSEYSNSFSDVDIGRVIASNMYSKGIDVIHFAAGLAGLGVIEAAKKLGDGYYVIGADQDQSHLAPKNFITSVIKNVGDALYLITSEYIKDNNVWEGGKVIQMGLRDGVVGLSNANEFEYIRVLERKIIDKEIVVPCNQEGYEIFIKQILKL
ncbi:nucleoside ABC transporter substrate-binding protein BmpB [Borreliella carolinensis]|uniref:Nucleoside ABC transporter substrate-binding protein BmpB n=1 Tax=Borreliella carolinensis TaxID=478174 RepID=A0ABY9E5Q2_9SPIR|nr:nucleoside ABC transporter substrate-binding protein BmpB [Borreliella carolinensis]WKC90767.1 nucleoside ABC transporter substrate-binding protein BmpB [Borreliella carolinensis]WNY67701.1 nucleoside ABC transporter substrate-binding protein BmpB [Borreliella carolinensis]